MGECTGLTLEGAEVVEDVEEPLATGVGAGMSGDEFAFTEDEDFVGVETDVEAPANEGVGDGVVVAVGADGGVFVHMAAGCPECFKARDGW